MKGGYRANAGRPKGSRDRMPRKKRAVPKLISDGVDLIKLNPVDTPLRFLLNLMNDEAAPIELRMRAAAVCLPFCHRRLSDARYYKKNEKEDRTQPTAKANKFGQPTAAPVLVFSAPKS